MAHVPPLKGPGPACFSPTYAADQMKLSANTLARMTLRLPGAPKALAAASSHEYHAKPMGPNRSPPKPAVSAVCRAPERRMGMRCMRCETMSPAAQSVALLAMFTSRGRRWTWLSYRRQTAPRGEPPRAASEMAIRRFRDKGTAVYILLRGFLFVLVEVDGTAA